MKTQLKYWTQYQGNALATQIINLGADAKGSYLIFDQTIIYPGGGGQPCDAAHFIFENKPIAKVTKCDFNDGAIKYYVDDFHPEKFVIGGEIVQCIVGSMRNLNAAYHTVGHWIAQAAIESLMVPWEPTSGHHYPNEAYVGFMGDIDEVGDDFLGQLTMAMRIDLQSNPKITTEIVDPSDHHKLGKALLPKNFVPAPNKTLRLVEIEGYRAIPCGGTHVSSLRDIKAFSLNNIKIKNGMIRIGYSCEAWPEFAS